MPVADEIPEHDNAHRHQFRDQPECDAEHAGHEVHDSLIEAEADDRDEHELGQRDVVLRAVILVSVRPQDVPGVVIDDGGDERDGDGNGQRNIEACKKDGEQAEVDDSAANAHHRKLEKDLNFVQVVQHHFAQAYHTSPLDS